MEIVERKLDPRVQRTRQFLREALIALILEKGYEGITVQDITDKAGLRRATFYLHYRDKEELMLVILKETVNDLMSDMGPLPPHCMDKEISREIALRTFKHVEIHSELYRVLIKAQVASFLLNSVRAYMAKHILEDYKREIPVEQMTIPAEVVADYAAGVKLNLIVWWLEHDMPYSAEQMADMCSRLIQEGARTALPELTSG